MSYSFLDLLCLLGSVALFLYGMKVMSEGLQKPQAIASGISFRL